MDIKDTLRRYGLFDAKVPRYTSYPPANRFLADVGARHQREWLGAVPADDPISAYVHIPFCRRLCWFCACRTQGTQTLRPVEAYLEHLLTEIETTAQQHLASGVKMARLHLGGGTPTLLSPDAIDRLLTALHRHLPPAENFEFSVEIDPTEAAPEVLDRLAAWNMTRASIGVQDFTPKVQQAIGRLQGFDETQNVVTKLRQGGVTSLNIDLLYGLPFQTAQSLVDTLDRVVSLRPDRLALYGYAHVPHMSKRQVMIPDAALPGAEQRFDLAQLAKTRLEALGYRPIGIDHFARPSDSLTQAALTGTLRRNFQGYTDDPCETLLGFGASAISKTPQGFLQNAVATAAYSQRIASTGLAAHKGLLVTAQDEFIGTMVQQIMCTGTLDLTDLSQKFPSHSDQISLLVDDLTRCFTDVVTRKSEKLAIKPGFSAMIRLVAARLDQTHGASHIHSLAI